MNNKRRNLLTAVINREIHGAYYPRDVKILRCLYNNGKSFKKVWQKYSKTQIVYDGNVYFDNFRASYDLSGLPDVPRLAYRKAKACPGEKIQTILHFESPVDQTTFNGVKNSPLNASFYCFALTKHNYLRIFDINSGNLLKEIFLSSLFNFKYLTFESNLERIVLKSTLLTTHHRSSNNDHILCLMVLSVCPVVFQCTLLVTKAIFGDDVCNASISNNLLVIMHKKGKITLYNFEDILKYNTVLLSLGQQLEPSNKLGLPYPNGTMVAGIIGEYPIGLPVNVVLSTTPCVLYKVNAKDYDLSFGGYPWQYIQRTDYGYNMRLVEDQILIGRLENNIVSIEPDNAMFHPDHSGSILHIEPLRLRCLKVKSNLPPNDNQKYQIAEKFVLDFRRRSPTQVDGTTKSGRRVKQVQYNCHGNITTDIVLDIDYDDELDILVVLYRDQNKQNHGIIGCYDNCTGASLCMVEVDGITDEDDHSVAIDKNMVVIISKRRTLFICTIYILLPSGGF